MKYLIILFTLLVSNSNSQTFESFMKIQSAKFEHKLAANSVLKTELYIYELIDGDISEKGELRNENFYNEKGKKIKSIGYFNNRKIENIYEYNSKDILISITVLNENGEIKQKMVNTYDEKDELNEIIYYDSNGELINRIDQRKEFIGKFRVSRNVNNEIVNKYLTAYDSVNKVYTSQRFSNNDQLLNENKYFFSSDLNIIKTSLIDNIQNRKHIEEHQLDSNGNRIKTIRKDFEGKTIWIFEYKFNPKGLQIESIWYDNNGMIKQITNTKYKYS